MQGIRDASQLSATGYHLVRVGCSSGRCGSFDELQQQGLQPSGITYSDYEPGELLTIF